MLPCADHWTALTDGPSKFLAFRDGVHGDRRCPVGQRRSSTIHRVDIRSWANEKPLLFRLDVCCYGGTAKCDEHVPVTSDLVEPPTRGLRATTDAQNVNGAV